MPYTDECELSLISGQSQHSVLVDRALRRLGAILRRSTGIALAGGTRTLSSDEAAVRFLKFSGAASTVVLGRAGEWAIRNGTGGVVTVKAGADAGVNIAPGDTVQVVSDGTTVFGMAAGEASWNSISGKPGAYPPSAHDHDDRYYTEGEVNSLLANKSNTNHNHVAGIVAPSLLNGWVNQAGGSTGSTLAGYSKDTTGRVWLQGVIRYGTIGQNAFVLPIGCRPALLCVCPAFSFNGSAGVASGVEVAADGGVKISVGSNVSFSLEGVSFLAA